MDKDKYKLGKTSDEKPEGFYDTDQIFEFLKGKKIFVKRKDNLLRFCENHGIQMVKFKREGSGGSTPTAYKIPTDTKIEQIRQSLMYINNSVLGLELVKKRKENLQIFDEAGNKEESKTSIATKVSKALGVPCNRKLVKKNFRRKKIFKIRKIKKS